MFRFSQFGEVAARHLGVNSFPGQYISFGICDVLHTVILGSIRRRRESARAARFVLELLAQEPCITTQLLDHKEVDVPIMRKRRDSASDAPPALREFSAHSGRADAIVIVTPGYNGGYLGVLKNTSSLESLQFHPLVRWRCLTALRQVILHLGGVPIPAILPAFKVRESFTDQGTPHDQAFPQRGRAYFDELLWSTEALTAQ